MVHGHLRPFVLGGIEGQIKRKYRRYPGHDRFHERGGAVPAAHETVADDATKTAVWEVYKFIHVNTAAPFGTFRTKIRKWKKAVL